MNTCIKIINDKNCNIIVLDNTLKENFIQVFLLSLTTSLGIVSTEVFVKSELTLTVSFNGSQDGFYTLCKIDVSLDPSSIIYYDNGRYYYNRKKVSLLEIINMPKEVSNVNIEYSYFFSTCGLKKCFIKICQEIFNSKNSICSLKNVDNSLIYKRDLIWSALNVILYLAEMDQMSEALRLLEEVTSCNGLCSSSKNNDCGCN